jgi:hypothetical protein
MKYSYEGKESEYKSKNDKYDKEIMFEELTESLIKTKNGKSFGRRQYKFRTG